MTVCRRDKEVKTVNKQRDRRKSEAHAQYQIGKHVKELAKQEEQRNAALAQTEEAIIAAEQKLRKIEDEIVSHLVIFYGKKLPCTQEIYQKKTLIPAMQAMKINYNLSDKW